ncbi:MAG: DUF2384 domain-containing protein [Nitrococcus sp.]|nr:DUF2384 domain-containing protein [Nitrococcus sp.]
MASVTLRILVEIGRVAVKVLAFSTHQRGAYGGVAIGEAGVPIDPASSVTYIGDIVVVARKAAMSVKESDVLDVLCGRRALGAASPGLVDIARAVRVLEYALDVIEDKAAALHWMRRPQHGLADGVPLELLQTDYGSRASEHLLGRIDHGVLG